MPLVDGRDGGGFHRPAQRFVKGAIDRVGAAMGLLLLLPVLAIVALVQLYRYRRVSTPTQRQQTKWIVLGVAAAVVGGIGQPYGAILGALLLGVATSMIGGYFDPSYTDITAFIILVLFLVFRPTGLFSGVVRRRDVVV